MGYDDEGPWVFKGRALYQLQLVKVSEARKYIPDSMRIVNMFGYTLGGFYLARYTDSPVGAFDELVAVAGLVWNFPGSCAWAARVYVNDRTARNHGLRTVGLPSRQASFTEDRSVRLHARRSWWHDADPARLCASAVPSSSSKAQRFEADQSSSTAAAPQQAAQQAAVDIDHPLVLWNSEGSPWWRRARNARGLQQPVCRLTLPPAPQGWPGPRTTILLPSFSGGTEDCPEILKYTCNLKTNVRPTKATALEVTTDDSPEALAAILGGRPLIAFNFCDMEMSVKEPKVHRMKPRPRRLAGREAQLQL